MPGQRFRVEARVRQGHGQGRGRDYLPWIKVGEFPSQGRASRVPGWKTTRVHHLFGQNELRHLYIADWSPLVTDVREQVQQLPELLEKGPEHYGFRGELWTCPRVVELVKQQVGVQ